MEKRKKVAFFLPYLEVGGIERLYVTYANHLTKEYDVSIITCSAKGAYRGDIERDVQLVELTGTRIRTSLLKLIRELRKNSYDYLIGSNMMANVIMLIASFFLKKTKYVVFQHNYLNDETKHMGFYARFSFYYMKWLYPKADMVVSVSKGIQQFVVESLRIPLEKAPVVYNAVDSDDVRDRSNEIIKDIPDNFIVFVGRLTVVKNLPLLINSFDLVNVSGLKLLIIGEGPSEKEVKEVALKSSKSKDIVFLGAKSNPMPYIKKAKCLVLPSLSESFGLVLLEALCLDTPVVSTPTKGAIEVLENCPNAFISNSFEDSVELAKLIDIACAHRFVVNNIIDKFSIFSSINELGKVLKSIS